MRRIQCNSSKGILITQSSIYYKFLIVTTVVTLNRRFVNKAAGNELFWVNLADKSTAMMLAIPTWVVFGKLDRLLYSDAADLQDWWHISRVKRADGYTSEEFKSNTLITQSSMLMI